MRLNPTVRRLWWLAFAVVTLAAGAAVLLTLFPAGTRAAGDGGVLPEGTPLASLKPESSLFLISDLSFPTDGKQLLVREDGLIRREDFFQNGNRVAERTLNRARPYCAILTKLPGGSFIERVKRLQIAETTAVPGGVRIGLYSIQESAIEELSCFSRGSPLTISALRAALGQTDGDARVTLLAPPGEPGAVLMARTPAAASIFHYKEALLDRPPSSPEDVYRNLRESHHAYIRYLDSLKPRREP